MGKLSFSIIVPVYNVENRLQICIESIMAQSEQDFELILVDDGSSDKSGKICDEYAEKYDKIRTFHKKNEGVSSARNLGIRAAHGKKLLFIDGDDTIEKDLLEVVKKRENSQLIIFGMSFDYYNKDSYQYSQKYSCGKDTSVTLEYIGKNFESFFLSNSLSSACNKIFDKELIDLHEIRFNDRMYLYEDFAFVLEYLKYTKTIECISHSYYHYQLQIEQKHLKKRVSDLARLFENMDHLEEKVKDLEKYAGDTYMGTIIFERLYIQLLYLHLLYAENVQESVIAIRKKMNEKNLQDRMPDLLQICGENEKKLLSYTCCKDEKLMSKWVLKKQMMYQIKQKIRPVLNKIKEMTGKTYL